MKQLFLFASLLFLLLNFPTFAQNTEFPSKSGNAFLRLCSAVEQDDPPQKETANVFACIGYVTGFINGVQYEQAFAETKNRKMPAPFCIPDGVENAQLVRVLMKYIRNNPESANQPTAWLLMDGLEKAYPC